MPVRMVHRSRAGLAVAVTALIAAVLSAAPEQQTPTFRGGTETVAIYATAEMAAEIVRKGFDVPAPTVTLDPAGGTFEFDGIAIEVTALPASHTADAVMTFVFENMSQSVSSPAGTRSGDVRASPKVRKSASLPWRASAIWAPG